MRTMRLGRGQRSVSRDPDAEFCYSLFPQHIHMMPGRAPRSPPFQGEERDLHTVTQPQALVAQAPGHLPGGVRWGAVATRGPDQGRGTGIDGGPYLTQILRGSQEETER